MSTVIRYAIGAALFAFSAPAFTADKPPAPLSERQQAAVRLACERCPATSMSGGPGIPPGKRFLAYDKDLGDCHKANRLETLLLLARIVDSGKPQEAIYAFANMQALEGDLIGGSLTIGFPVEYVDRTGADATRSLRAVMRKIATELLAKAGAPQMAPPTPITETGAPQMVPPTPPQP